MLTDPQAALLFQGFAKQPDLFALKPAAYRKAAIDVVVTQLKDTGCDLGMARRIVSLVGSEPLLAVLDEQPSTVITALIKKFDKANADRAKSEGRWARSHLAELVESRAEPTAAAPKATRTPAPKKPKKEVVRALHQARSMGGG
ncbi:MAG: hypothetical protein K8S25_08700 [Alphaproteobacteria bacterium]|nr:hypothetical protein [Alphaproteobacteria bacterium]